MSMLKRMLYKVLGRMSGLDLTQPIIWTSRGNVNESDVVKFSEWEQHSEGAIVHIVGCRDKRTLAEIKRGVYVLHPGLNATAVKGQFS